MTACSKQILKQVYITGRFDVSVDNALTLEANKLQFGGPLVKDTEVTANFALNFGTTGSRIRQFGIRTNNQITIDYNNGVNGNSLTFNALGIVLENTIPFAKGLQGGSDFRANYDDLTYIQKIYADTRIAGRPISPILANPTITENTYSVSWDNIEQRFTLTPGGGIVAGDDTQVIYNSGGVLVGNPNFIFGSNILSVPHINLGSTNPIAGSDRIIQVISDQNDTNLVLKPKGAGNLSFSLLQGAIIIGDSLSANTNHVIRANGNQSQIDISLEPKGTNGVVYIGNVTEAGGYRYLKARGFNTDVGVRIQSKGNALVILEPSDGDADDASVKIGEGNGVTVGTARRLIYADSNKQRTDLQIGGFSINSQVQIGRPTENAPNRFLTVATSATNCNFKITAKGTGATFIDGRATIKVAIGDWNMDANDTVALIPPGISDYTKILSIFAKIYEDGSTVFTRDLNYKGAGGIHWNSGVVYLERTTGGFFDSANYDATGFNRGYLYITYEE